MSRTLHVDLTPSRRSKRLLQNGYYLQPPGEQISQNEMSSEDDDDNASIHSNASSVYSERAVHYSESPTAVFNHKRKKRKGVESPRHGNLLLQAKSHSPLVQKKKFQLSEAGTSSRSTPNLSVSRREKLSSSVSNHTHATRETKTTITSIRQTSHRYARGESSIVTQNSYTSSQSSSQNTNNTANRAQQHENVMTRNQAHYDAIGGGDQRMVQRSDETTSVNTQLYSTPRVDSHGEAEITQHSSSETRRRKMQSQYSSESEIEEENALPRLKQYELETTVPLLLTNISNTVWIFLSWISTCFGYICRTIYQTTLTIFVFDVRWLAVRTSPLFAKVARYLLFLLLFLLLLTTAYLFATRIASQSSQLILLPVQSIAGLFQMLSHKISSFSVFPETRRPVVHQESSSYQSSQQLSLQDFDAALVEAKLQFYEKLTEIKTEISKIQKEQQDYSVKQEKLTDLHDQTMQKLMSLKNEMDAIQTSQSKAGDTVKADIEELRDLLADKSHMTVKISEFNNRLAAFDARLNTLDNLVMKSVKNFDQHVGNTSYVKEIARMQFIESFLNVLKTTEGSTEEKNNLHFLFIAWLNKQGFAKVEDVDKNMKHLTATHNLTMAVLEKKFATQIERIRHEARRHSSTITLEKIVERPLKQEETINVGMEAEVRRWIQDELAVYSADRIALADHALESAGGFIVSTRCSESYNKKTALVSLFGIPIYYNINTPRSVIQAGTLPGECWSFKGSEGYVVVALSGAVRPTSFTIDHIPRELSPHGRIDSAPKDFNVLGLKDVYDYEGVVLGKYRYEQDGAVIQQFSVTSDSTEYFTHIELRVTSNWGHPDYTCLYRFRVHGERRAMEPPPV